MTTPQNEAITSTTVPLIPREVLFGNPERTSPEISPDGTLLGYLAPDERDVLQVWVRTLGAEDDRAVTTDPQRGIRFFTWTYNPGELLYLQDAGGDENWRLYRTDAGSGEARDLTPFEGVQAHLVALEPELPGTALVALNRDDPRTHDVYALELASGELTLDTKNRGDIVGWTADARLRVRAALTGRPDGGWELLTRATPETDWASMRVWGPEDEGYPAGFSKDGETLYVRGSHDANAHRLLAVDMQTGEERVIAEDPQYDVGGLLIHPTERTVQAVSFERDRLEWRVLDEQVVADFDALGDVHRGDFQVVSRDLADRTWIVAYTTDDGPVYYYRYNRADRRATLLFSQRPRLEGLPLRPMEPVSYATDDGFTIHAYLTLPAEADTGPVPAVVLVHGGPWGRDSWGFNAEAQWLANRGYAVLQPNFRGSTGYGKAFLNAGNREWGAKMQNDLTEGARWLIARGIADPEQIAIMGGSYGGYATLAGLAFTPEVWAAGVDIVGPSSLITLFRTIPPYWEPIKAIFAHRMGDPDEDEEFLRNRSPLFFVDQITVPLLIAQGANDPRVKRAESEQIVEAMRGADKSVEYVVYEDEGHGFARPENRLHFYAQAETFLAHHLGGRAEPEGEIAGHSAQAA